MERANGQTGGVEGNKSRCYFVCVTMMYSIFTYRADIEMDDPNGGIAGWYCDVPGWSE